MEILFKKLSLFIFLVSILLRPECCQADESKIDPKLLTTLQSGQNADVIVFFQNGIQPALTRAADLRSTEPNQILRNQQFIDALQENSEESQNGVLKLLSGRQTERGADAGFESFTRYWLGNKVYIKSANLETILALAEDPQVSKIEEEVYVDQIEFQLNAERVEQEEELRHGHEPIEFDEDWAQKRMQLEEAWEHLGGNKGEGVIVAAIDSGVVHEHEALIDNFVGVDYGWFDTINKKLTPYDDYGHGTHVTGLIAGSKGIGAAPGAKWMHCKAIHGRGRSSSETFGSCLQFVACPTLPDGTNPDCSRAPQIVSNSWHIYGEPLNDEISALRTLDIIPLFANGNNGPLCDSSVSPGELPYVIDIGATDPEHQVAVFSSLGYADDGQTIKPDFVAPGASVTSSVPGKNGELNAYEVYSGSSMATPLVAGVVALLKVRNPDLTYEEAYDLLAQNAEHTVTRREYSPEYDCNRSIDEYPNIYVGYGFVNALKVLEGQTNLMKKRK